MAKLSLKEKELNRERQEKLKKGYKDFWYLLIIVGVVWLLQLPAIIGLLMSDTRSHFSSYGIMMIIITTVGFLTAVLLLALDKRKSSVLISSISAALILLICALIYWGYERALNVSNMHVAQIIVSYVSSIIVPIANAIMVSRRI